MSRHVPSRSALFVLGILLGLTSPCYGQPTGLDGHQVLQVDVADEADLAALTELLALYPEVELWSETLSVGAGDSAPVSSSTVLEAGRTYLLKASGTASAGDTIDFDAKYSITSRIAGDTWTDAVSGYVSYGTELLDLFVDGAAVDWGDYNADHEYEYEIGGDGTGIDLLIYDIYYPNNTGYLTVDICKWTCSSPGDSGDTTQSVVSPPGKAKGKK